MSSSASPDSQPSPESRKPGSRFAFLVPSEHVKTVKSLLESHGRLSKQRKIEPYNGGLSASTATGTGRKLIVPILLDQPNSSSDDETDGLLELQTLLQSHLSRTIAVTISTIQVTNTPTDPSSRRLSPAQHAWTAGLSALPPGVLDTVGLHATELLKDMPTTYTMYPPLLLLPPNAFAAPTWGKLLSLEPLDGVVMQQVLGKVAEALRITHVAVNAPIALHTTNGVISSTFPSPPSPSTANNSESENILRSPAGLTPLYGSFGPLLPPAHRPVASDYAAAFWVSARQNGITQVWAPRYTMFSRGNISEKARLLTLTSVAAAVREGEICGSGCTAVDLYAGIGYFAFSYRAAGVSKVLGWELNAWSVEGLRRGASRNGWGVRIVDDEEQGMVEMGSEDFLVFRESNLHATRRIGAMRDTLPPIRHVNCGLLPTSRGSWETAVEAVDPELGGWIHLHENFATAEIEHKATDTLSEIEEIFVRMRKNKGDAGTLETKLEHVERVKTYAPGVMHCVLDIHIPPRVVASTC